MYFLVINMLWLDHYQKELEKKMLSEISKEEIHKHVMKLVQWERDSGTEDAGMACMYIKEELEEKGVSVEIHSIDAFLSQGANAELKVLCPEVKMIKNVMAHAFSGSTDESGFCGELIDAENIIEESAARAHIRTSEITCFFAFAASITTCAWTCTGVMLSMTSMSSMFRSSL